MPTYLASAARTAASFDSRSLRSATVRSGLRGNVAMIVSSANAPNAADTFLRLPGRCPQTKNCRICSCSDIWSNFSSWFMMFPFLVFLSFQQKKSSESFTYILGRCMLHMLWSILDSSKSCNQKLCSLLRPGLITFTCSITLFFAVSVA